MAGIGMDFFDNVGNKVSKMGSSLSSKVKDTIEQMRLENEVRSLESEKSQYFETLGRMLYQHRNGQTEAEPDYDEYIEKIRDCDERIAGHRARIEAINAAPVCPSCGNAVQPGQKFCMGCGAKLVG